MIRGDTSNMGELTSLAGREDRPVLGAIAPEALGTASIEPPGAFVAGSYQTFTLTYTAGLHGIDDSGALRLCFRFATDQGRLQFVDPDAPNYTVITASNNAKLEYHYDYKANVRPWDRTLYIKVVDGFLREGETITIRMGVTNGTSPGLRLQTFCEPSFNFRVLVDPIATFNFQPLRDQPTISIVPGPPARYLASVPTLWSVDEPFDLKLKGEDIWGNPSDQCDIAVTLRCAGALENAPKRMILGPGERAVTAPGLRFGKPGDYIIELVDGDGKTLCTTNPIRVHNGTRRHAWGDLHGQSEETIGTNSAAEYFAFARNLAFVDVAGHQGNDFQITNEFWNHLNALTAAFEEPGKFITLPGYEWSGNTCLGGDRNVYFPNEGRMLRRSSHALVPDKSDLHTDCTHARDLFQALAESNERDVVIFAHCGGRYADIRIAHDGWFERSVEIHSSWGTFDWILYDAFDMGYRVGIVCNSDGHKGRPGASYPGASLFGAIGGLTCFNVAELTRTEIFDCLRKRHHYGTTGGPNGRMFLSVDARFTEEATIYHDDPAIGPADGATGRAAVMGDIVHLPTGGMEIEIDINAGCPIERIELFNGRDLIKIMRPYGEEDLGRRVRLEWSGARYRGRFRQVIWDGHATVSGNTIVAATPANFFNPEKRLVQKDGQEVVWQSLTTGNRAGCDLSLAEPHKGDLKVRAGPISFELPIATIGFEDKLFEVAGELPRTIRVVRLPDELRHQAFRASSKVEIVGDRDNPIYVRIVLEDGTVAWSSPIYVYR